MDVKSAHEVILWMEKCDPSRLTPNKIMLCIRNTFILENMRDFMYEEFVDIITSSGNAGIIRL